MSSNEAKLAIEVAATQQKTNKDEQTSTTMSNSNTGIDWDRSDVKTYKFTLNQFSCEMDRNGTFRPLKAFASTFTDNTFEAMMQLVEKTAKESDHSDVDRRKRIKFCLGLSMPLSCVGAFVIPLLIGMVRQNYALAFLAFFVLLIACCIAIPFMLKAFQNELEWIRLEVIKWQFRVENDLRLICKVISNLQDNNNNSSADFQNRVLLQLNTKHSTARYTHGDIMSVEITVRTRSNINSGDNSIDIDFKQLQEKVLNSSDWKSRSNANTGIESGEATNGKNDSEFTKEQQELIQTRIVTIRHLNSGCCPNCSNYS